MTSRTVHGQPATGRQILGAAWTMLKTDRAMLWLPVISGTASLFTALVLFIPGFVVGRALGANGHVDTWIGGALAAFGGTIVAIFFQAALVIGAFQRVDGQQPTLGGVLAAAWRMRGPVLSWALLTSTAGLVVRTLERRLGVLGQLLGFLGGLAWAIVSFLVLPVVVAEGLGPVAAIKRSAQLLRDTWGTSLRTTVRFGVIQVLLTLGLVAVFAVGAVLALAGPLASTVSGIAVMVVALIAFVALLAFVSAVSTYARALIYRYAVGLAVPGVPDGVFAGAFVPKKRRR